MIIGILKPLINDTMQEIFHVEFIRYLRKRDISFVEFGLGDHDFFNALNLIKHRDDTVLYLGGHFHLRLLSSSMHPVSLSALVGRPTLGIWADHPFASFWKDKTVNFWEGIHTMSPISGFSEVFHYLRPGYSKYRSVPYSPLVHSVQSEVGHYETRDNDVVIAVGIRNTNLTLESIIGKCKNSPSFLDERLVANYVDAAIDDYKTYPLTLFASVFRDCYGVDLEKTRNVTMNGEPMIHFMLFNILHDLDMWIRSERRIKMLKTLDMTSFKGKITILSDMIPGIPQGDNIFYIGQQTYKDYIRLLRRSRFNVFANATYHPNYINERVADSLIAGCSAISDFHYDLKEFGSNNGVFVQDEQISLSDIVEVAKKDYDQNVANGRNIILNDKVSLCERVYYQLKSILHSN